MRKFIPAVLFALIACALVPLRELRGQDTGQATAPRPRVKMTKDYLVLLRPGPAPASSPAGASSQRREGFVTMPDGTNIYYRQVGSGGPAVIIPGNLFLFDALQRLGRGRTLLFYDMRGRGRSDALRDTARISIQQDVEDLEHLRRHFGYERVSVVGYSYLGLMVALYAAAHPARVERVVQLGPVPRKFGSTFPEGLGLAARPVLADSTPVKRAAELRQAGYDRTHPVEYCELLWSYTRHGLVGDPSKVDQLGPSRCHLANEWALSLDRHFRYHFASAQRLDVPWAHFAAVTMPVLTIHGTRDRNAPYGAGREWALRLPNARLLTVPGAAHAAFIDAPDLVLGAVDEFLNGRWPEGAERVVSLEPRR
jgi:pimeloyl-ACP methyl ester carboxylesterase